MDSLELLHALHLYQNAFRDDEVGAVCDLDIVAVIHEWNGYFTNEWNSSRHEFEREALLVG